MAEIEYRPIPFATWAVDLSNAQDETTAWEMEFMTNYLWNESVEEMRNTERRTLQQYRYEEMPKIEIGWKIKTQKNSFDMEYYPDFKPTHKPIPISRRLDQH